MSIRLRSKGTRGNVSMRRGGASGAHQVTHSSHNACPVAVGSVSYNVIRDDRQTMADTVTPGYFSLVKKKGSILPVQTCTSEKWSYYEGDFTSRTISWDRYYTPDGSTIGRHDYNKSLYLDGFPVSMPSSLPLATATGMESHASLLTEALASARSDIMDGSTFIAEAGKTYSMVTGFARRVLKARKEILRAMKRGDSWTVGKNFSQLWLEWRYGWRILRFEAKDVNETVKRLEERAISLVRKSRQSIGTSSKTYGSWTTLPRDWSANFIQYRTIDYTQQVNRAGVGILHSWKTPIQFDPLVTAWELVPFSFVVDWFLSVGTFLEAASPFMLGDEKFRWISTETVRKRDFEFRYHPTEMSKSGVVLTGLPLLNAPSWSYSVYDRSPTSLDPTISFKLKLDMFKMADLMALFIVLKGR